MKFVGIIAQDPKGVIGKGNDIPWSLPEDMKFFKETTTGHTVLMGRRTYDSIGKALPNRRNIVLSRSEDLVAGVDDNVEVYSSLDDIQYEEDETVFVIGGSEIYKMFQDENLLDGLYITKVLEEYEGDTYSPFKHMPQFAWMKGVKVTDDFIIKYYSKQYSG